MAKLLDIYNLQGSTILAYRIICAWLVYNLTTADNAIRSIPLIDFLMKVNVNFDINTTLPDYNLQYPDNTQPVSLLFVLGLFLGDGNIFILIRDTGQGVMFVPIFRITQKDSMFNARLMELISKDLSNAGLLSRVYRVGPNIGVNYEGLNSFTSYFMGLMPTLSQYFVLLLERGSTQLTITSSNSDAS